MDSDAWGKADSDATWHGRGEGGRWWLAFVEGEEHGEVRGGAQDPEGEARRLHVAAHLCCVGPCLNERRLGRRAVRDEGGRGRVPSSLFCLYYVPARIAASRGA